MQDAGLYVFIAVSVFFLASIVLLIMFCFNTGKSIYWLISVALFVFGSILNKDDSLPTFLAILISAVMLIIFGSRGEIIHTIAAVFVFFGAVFSNVVDSIFVFAIIVTIVYSIVNKYISVTGSNAAALAQKHH